MNTLINWNLNPYSVIFTLIRPNYSSGAGDKRFPEHPSAGPDSPVLLLIHVLPPESPENVTQNLHPLSAPAWMFWKVYFFHLALQLLKKKGTRGSHFFFVCLVGYLVLVCLVFLSITLLTLNFMYFINHNTKVCCPYSHDTQNE